MMLPVLPVGCRNEKSFLRSSPKYLQIVSLLFQVELPLDLNQLAVEPVNKLRGTDW